MELIKVIEKEGQKAVDARALYDFLEVNTPFSKWIQRMLEYGFVENIDWTKMSSDNQSFMYDYVLTLDCAKEISMIQRSEKGKQARLYFIEMEKKAIKPMSQIELIIQSAQILAEIERKQNILESRIEAIENAPQINAPIEQFSILGYCHNIHKQISLDEAKLFGIKCRSLCRQMGFVIGKIPDPRFGSVNTYPLDVLKQIIEK
jgi:anti-repressor protein